MRCTVSGCNVDNRKKDFTSDIKFFSFPSDKKTALIWKHLCKRSDDFNMKYARICSKHFVESDYNRNLKHELLGYEPKNYRALKKDAVPSKNLPKVSKPNTKIQDKEKRQERLRGPKSLDHNVLNRVNTEVNTETKIDERDRIIASLQKKIQDLQQRQSVLSKIFSEAQFKKLEGSKTHLKWSVEDITKSIVLYSAGPRAYRLLLKKGYPFPAVSSLRSWLKKLKIAPGILKGIFHFMKSTNMTLMEKICVISFEEMKLKKSYVYDKTNDETLKPYSYAQIVMLRGLFKNWKQPVFYDFDYKLSKERLFEIINFAESSGFQVVAMVSDTGIGSRSLHNELKITHTSPWFKNPANNQNIYVFADVPHLIKLLRNHFVDQGFIIDNKEINKTIIEELLDATNSIDLKIANKISRDSISFKGGATEHVKLAAKLFSHTVSMAITTCGTTGLIKQENWMECAEFFKLVNDWFDIMNDGNYLKEVRERTKAYGLALDIQDNIINSMTNTIESLKVKGKSPLLPFQKGIIMSNIALKLLWADLKIRFSCENILTCRLNLDVFENFFGVIRSKGSLDDPDTFDFKYKLRSYILGCNEGSLPSTSNVEEDIAMDDINLCGKYFSSIKNILPETEDCDNKDENELNGIEYDLGSLASYIYQKLEKPHLNPTPSPEFMTNMEKLEYIFQSVNLDTLFITKKYLKQLLSKSSSILCSDETKILFFRSRTIFRIKELNRVSRKRKLPNIIKKKTINTYSIIK